MAGEINFGILDTNAPAKIATSFIQGQQLGQQYRAQELQNQAAEAQYQNMLAKQEAYKAAGGDYNKLAQELTNRGLPEEALKIRKDVREEKKLGMEMDLKNQELFAKTLERVAANPTDQELGAYLTKGVASGWFTQDQAAQAAAGMQGLNLEQRMKKLAPQALGMKDYLSYQNQVRQTDISEGNLAETRRGHDLMYGSNVVANTVTDNAGNVTQFNRYGQIIGQPGAVGKSSGPTAKSLESIDQLRATIKGAKEAVTASPDAFGFGRGMMGETIGGRMGTPEENEARAYLFNTISGVIKERAGTAQSAGERATLNRFLPLPTDNAQVITDKLNAFDKYLNDREKALTTTPNTPKAPKEPGAGGMPSLSDIDAEIARRKKGK